MLSSMTPRSIMEGWTDDSQTYNNETDFFREREKMNEKSPEEMCANYSSDDSLEDGSLNTVSVLPKNKKRKKKRKKIWIDVEHARHAIDIVSICAEDLGWNLCNSSEKKSCKIRWITYTGNGADDNVLSAYAFPRKAKKTMINRFPGMAKLVSKTILSKRIGRLKDYSRLNLDFAPSFWILPRDMPSFRSYSSKEKTYIAKPDMGSQGEGIFLLRGAGKGKKNDERLEKEFAFDNGRTYVVQEYISNPLLIENKKFDLRLYVLLTSINPVKIRVCKEGLARFCTQDYTKPSPKNYKDVYMHLTNYSLNKYSKDFDHGDDCQDVGETGTKRKLSHVFPLLLEAGLEEEAFWENVEDLALKSIVAIEPELRIWERARQDIDLKGGAGSFQILGFDVLIDSDHKLWLLEINHNPSLSIDGSVEISPGVLENSISQVDVEVKKDAVIGALKHAMLSVSELSEQDEQIHDFNIDDIYRKELQSRKDDKFCVFLNLLEEFFSEFCTTKKEPNICSATRFNRQIRKLPLCKDVSSAEVDLIFLRAKRRIVEDEDWGGSGLPFFEFVESLVFVLARVFEKESSLGSNDTSYCKLLSSKLDTLSDQIIETFLRQK